VAFDWLRNALALRTRRRIARQRVAIRQFDGRQRELPNVLLIGGQRCGTSSLYKYLGQHPEVSPSIRKEVEYFTLHFAEGESWYRAHFLTTREKEKAGVRVVFEATPNYLLDPRCAERAAASLPGARIIVLLRDPVERAFSHYQHNRRLNHEPLSFADAIGKEVSRTAAARSQLALDPTIPLPMELRRYSYVERGFYAEQLGPWIRYFGHERVLALTSDEMYRDPASVFRNVTSFLELSSWMPGTFENHSYIGRKNVASSADFSATLRRELADTFVGPNRSLEELLDRVFDWSRPPSIDPESLV
jgi:hypothetical protein